MSSVLTRSGYADPATSLNFKTGSWRTLRPAHKHATAPCHGACPAGEDQQAWLAKIQENDVRAAWETLVNVNPMPAITGRVCPHPCETACNRGHLDQPIAIHNLERWLGDEAIANDWPYPNVPAVDLTRPKVAVIGAGPSGLSAAYHLTRRGYRVTILEALTEAGGLLKSAIPMTRLPRDVLDAEISRVLELGIDLQLRQRLGRDFQIDELGDEYAAVFLGIGCQKSREWSVGGAVPADLHEGLHLLKGWVDHLSMPEAERVVVHGGGNTAVDLCRIMKRKGAAEVTLITASGLPGPDTEPDDVLNVVPRELDEALEEGVEIIPHATIQRLIMRGSRVVGVEMVSLKKLPGKSGRKERIAFEGTERVVPTDMVVPCIGEVVDPEGVSDLLHGGSYLRAKDAFGHLADHPNVFVGGDARGDRGTVSAAIGDGRLASAAIDSYLNESPLPDLTPRPPIPYEGLNLHYYEKKSRVTVPKVPPERRTDDLEIEGAVAGAAAIAEAHRCFSCGNCLACDNCWTLCPDNAVIKTAQLASDGSHYLFDYDFCKGCGICATECPCGYIEMIPEP
ncbi:MAG: FAD-dependent oxidoreductase [Rhodospirillaceae bacterium]|nr:FAD-dependent oxidoreductase [Rhodospirillaceae bacterium]